MKIFKNRKKSRWVLTIIFSLLLLFLIYIVGNMIYSQISNKVPAIMGYSIMNVISTSMEPQIPENTFILIKEVDPALLKIGDVITFYSRDPSIEGLPNTHRIYDIENDGTNLVFVTKGDANAIPDSYKVYGAEIIGQYQNNILTMGRAGRIFQSNIVVFVLLVIPATVLFLFEIINFAKTAKSIKDPEKQEQKEKEVKIIESTGDKK